MHFQNLLSTLMFAVVVLFIGSSMAQLKGGSVKIEPFPSLPVPSTPCPSFSYDAFYNLAAGTSTTSPYVTVQEGLTGSGCSTKGVLKLALASADMDPSRRRVMVDMFFSNPTGWVFNLGDSSTNNGWAGDAATQSNDAEFHGNGRKMTGWYDQPTGSGVSLSMNNLYTNRLTLIAGDRHIVWLSDNQSVDSFNYKHHEGLFALNGQSDTEGSVNYDLYLGLNKVIQRYSSRTGSGLCRVGIKFLPEY